MIRWHLHYTFAKGIAVCTISVDVFAAFYTMIRELVLPFRKAQGRIDEVLDRTGIPIEFQDDVKNIW